MVAGLTLVCPIRGRLKAKAKSSDGLTPSEEKWRVEAIRHLIDQGYPASHFKVETVIKRFGNAGRNSFRADFVVLDQPVASLPDDSVDTLLDHAVLLAEIKRDNAAATKAKSFQALPLLDFAKLDDCVALYWDDIEQRVYWQTRAGGKRRTHEGPLVSLPEYGQPPGAPSLTFATISPDTSLLGVFKRVEDILHSASIGPQKRYGFILQLLIAKLHDEHVGEANPAKPLVLQDFEALEVHPVTAAERVNSLLGQAVRYYQPYLPEKVPEKLKLSGTALMDVMKILAPVKIIAMRQSVIQDFYMYFARHLYKWDMAQYFTPTSLTDFIIEVLNPQYGEHIKDPACGSADFLTAAFRRGQHWTDYASSVWGSDVSPEAVQVAVLNMILNGDGKTNVKEEDSLAKIASNEETVDIVVCNPPFGTRIREKSRDVLANFDLGHEWQEEPGGRMVPGSAVLGSEQVGVLFAEACVRLVRPGGRVALIVPNGYLGNRSPKYQQLREWILRHCRIAVVVALPRFTFKTSGADVSASVMFLEKRETPLLRSEDTEEYEFAVEVVDRVGWSVGDKRAEPIYKRDPDDGTYLLTDDDELILDSDFAAVFDALRGSDASQYFGWLRMGLNSPSAVGWTVSIGDIVADEHRTLDAKRLCRRVSELRRTLRKGEHFTLGDLVEVIKERHTSDGKVVTVKGNHIYRHVDLENISIGSFRTEHLHGWQLPDRAKHFAEPDDIYVGSIWSSVQKWCMVGKDASGIVVTNGCHRLRLRQGQNEDSYVDLIAGLSSETYRTQMRGLARGSDGLAEIAESDLLSVVLPRVTSPDARAELQPFVDQLRAGFTTIEAKIVAMQRAGSLGGTDPPPRSSHTAVV